MLRTFGLNLGVAIAAAGALLTGCNGSGVQPSYPTSDRLTPRIVAPTAFKQGIYVSQNGANSILGYKMNEQHNKSPFCSVGPVDAPYDVAVDGRGNLIDPDSGSRNLLIFAGPVMCGSQAAVIADPYGQPVDAASGDALNGTIAVGNLQDNGKTNGSVSLCSVQAGCTSNLTNPSMYQVAGVAMDLKGNCWASAVDYTGIAQLVYFAGCAGGGVVATGFVNASDGGLDIDTKGNLVAIDGFDNSASAVYVYKGCNPECERIAGPLALQGISVYGKLNRNGTMFASAHSFNSGQVDVYAYSPESLTYKYSFNTGLGSNPGVEGIAFNPRSKE